MIAVRPVTLVPVLCLMLLAVGSETSGQSSRKTEAEKQQVFQKLIGKVGGGSPEVAHDHSSDPRVVQPGPLASQRNDDDDDAQTVTDHVMHRPPRSDAASAPHGDNATEPKRNPLKNDKKKGKHADAGKSDKTKRRHQRSG